ncbi:type II toxin-antitoxin system Phd/YefM family antitoxin [Roseofilum sp. BLCC_M91]|uniref:Antitoxin n=1 Tax=Roseofilum halophilum BLCC-M91 TaxID=3022259 RepID=A0ABT7BLE3_9CYAN|nr:type II toxin-antitoxin system Phd/YefM family antitoxin [Roseofilum halophilum]MDJ1180015.1 type II toxin-antitoxin system Phd/YefM family antitoxin [Roseofilum halophilum BLCC-M91]
MLNLSRDIQSLSNFKRNTSEFIEQMKQTGSPMVLTVNGKAELVVQDAASYQKLLEAIEYLETITGIQQGLDDLNAGRVRPLEAFTKEMQQKHGIPSSDY